MSGGEFEIVYISSDSDEDGFLKYFSTMPWKVLWNSNCKFEILYLKFWIRILNLKYWIWNCLHSDEDGFLEYFSTMHWKVSWNWNCKFKILYLKFWIWNFFRSFWLWKFKFVIVQIVNLTLFRQYHFLSVLWRNLYRRNLQWKAYQPLF